MSKRKNPIDFYRGLKLRRGRDGRVEAHREFPICDFCLGRPVRWRFPVDRAVKIEIGPNRVTDDDWAACESCRGLIEAADADALVRRSLEKQIERYFPAPDEIPSSVLRIVEGELRQVHQQFMKARTGPPVRVIYPTDEEVEV